MNVALPTYLARQAMRRSDSRGPLRLSGHQHASQPSWNYRFGETVPSRAASRRPTDETRRARRFIRSGASPRHPPSSFQDIYEWAGELRTVEINKGGHQFQFRRYIETGMADVHRRLIEDSFLRGISVPEFAQQAAVIIGDVNYVHPFREGNGRTQAQYLKQLAAAAGHDLDLARIDPMAWIEASKASHAADYSPMAEVIRRAVL